MTSKANYFSKGLCYTLFGIFVAALSIMGAISLVNRFVEHPDTIDCTIVWLGELYYIVDAYSADYFQMVGVSAVICNSTMIREDSYRYEWSYNELELGQNLTCYYFPRKCIFSGLNFPMDNFLSKIWNISFAVCFCSGLGLLLTIFLIDCIKKTKKKSEKTTTCTETDFYELGDTHDEESVPEGLGDIPLSDFVENQ